MTIDWKTPLAQLQQALRSPAATPEDRAFRFDTALETAGAAYDRYALRYPPPRLTNADAIAGWAQRDGALFHRVERAGRELNALLVTEVAPDGPMGALDTLPYGEASRPVACGRLAQLVGLAPTNSFTIEIAAPCLASYLQWQPQRPSPVYSAPHPASDVPADVLDRLNRALADAQQLIAFLTTP